MAALFRYAAFISYSSKDAAFARRLHRALESYGIPASLGKFDLIGGGKKNRIYPVFRDREELPAGDLGEEIEAALTASGALVVVCSEQSAKSPWVEKEIEFFFGLGRRNRTFAIVADSAPLFDEAGQDLTKRLFPPALSGQSVEGAPYEPLAGDARKGKDGFRNAWLKVIAGLIGVSPGQLVDRDKRRRRQQRRALAAGLGAALVIASLISAAVDAQRWRTRFSSHAELVANEGRAREALPYAIAAMPVTGAALPLQGERAHAMLTRLGAARIVAELGDLQAMRLSSGGAVVAALQADMRGSGRLYDLAAIRAAQGAERIDLGAVGQPDVGGFLLSGNGRTLLAGDMMGGGQRMAYDLDALRAGRQSAPLDFGFSTQVQLSFDGSRVVTRDRDGDLIWTDLNVLRAREGNARISLGDADDAQALLSADGARIVLRLDGGAFDLIQIVDGESGRSLARMRFSIPDDNRGLRDLVLSSDGKRLFAHNYDDEGFVVDLDKVADRTANPLTLLGDLNAYWGHVVSADGATLVTQAEDGLGTAYDLREPGLRAGLGSLGAPQFGFSLSHDGARAISVDENHHAIFTDVRAALRGRLNRVDLGDVGEPSQRGVLYSGDGRFLLILRADRSGVLVDIDAALANGPDAKRDLGDLGDVYPLLDSALLSYDGSALILRSGQGSWSIYDLTHQVWSDPVPTGASFTRAVCNASGQGVRPFSEDLRRSGGTSGAAGQEQRNLRRVLAGRPWNPCDWRGVFAILPDRARGDGWFEGLRQWARLVAVRRFGAADWSCDETVSNASSDLRRARAEMCERFAEVSE